MKGKTIIKFKNGGRLELPEGMYNILDFANSGFSECCWKDGTASKKVTFRWEDVLYVKTTTQSTQENF